MADLDAIATDCLRTGDTVLLGAALARLAQARLHGSGEWRSRWCDDVTALVVESDEVHGLLIWGEGGTTAQWVEPFRAQLDEHWTLWLGAGGEPVSYEDRHRQVDPASVTAWLFILPP